MLVFSTFKCSAMDLNTSELSGPDSPSSFGTLVSPEKNPFSLDASDLDDDDSVQCSQHRLEADASTIYNVRIV